MYYEVQKKSVIQNFEDKASDALSQIMSGYHMKEHIAGELSDSLRIDINTIDKVLMEAAKLCIDSELKVAFPKVRINFVAGGVSLTAKSKDEDILTYSFKKKIILRPTDTDESVFQDFASWLHSLYEMAIVNAMQRVNVNAVNAVLEDLISRAGLNYRVQMVTSFGQEDKALAYISDDELVYVADDDKIFKLDEVLVMRSPDSLISEEDIENAKKAMAEQFATAHNVFEFLQGGFALIKFLGKQGLKKPLTLIKDITHKKIEKQSRGVDGLVYYSNDGVFAIAEFKDGEVDTVLSPFNTTTFEKVEGIDLAAMLKVEA